MDLKSRLAQLDRLTRKAAHEVVVEPEREARCQEEVLASMGLVERETAQGTVWTREHRDEVPSVAEHFADMCGLFTREPSACPAAEELLLMDTETTGLAGGTGTLVFQLGVSWWESGALTTRQYFLPGPANEAAMLMDVAALAQNFTNVVTFNGASFDLPLIRTRALLNRLPDPFAELTSWDLLVPARRMWGHLLPDCRQQTLEKWICGVERGDGDIDGSLIPQTWFDFLSTGQSGALPNVLTHNHRDMVGMANILNILGDIGLWIEDGDGLERELPVSAGWHGRDGWWALGKIFERRSDVRAAAVCFGSAWCGGWDAIIGDKNRIRFRRDAVRNLKRHREWELVAEIIADGLADGEDEIRLHREAAILYEHRMLDLERALEHAIASGEPQRQKRLMLRLERSAVSVKRTAKREVEQCK